ncbi:MAG: SHOCT domain-containing protein [Chloroflexi bacterium]|nr:SHOCT domain-containing protein [Chloroflexota bacterium]
MGIFMIFVPVLVIWAIVALARGDTWFGSQRHSEHAESAMELLKKRYARGEVSKEEFEEKKRALA